MPKLEFLRQVCSLRSKTVPSVSRRRQAAILKIARKIHRVTGSLLFVFFFVIAVTGLLLGWKKNTNGLILADTQVGRSTDPFHWLPLGVLQDEALRAAHERLSMDSKWAIDRFDVRPDKGIVKILFVDGYWGMQLDCTTGEVLSIERRRSDFIENIHDGIIFDQLLGTRGEPIKLFYTTVMGTALLTFTITGFWLWYGPKRFKAGRNKQE